MNQYTVIFPVAFGNEPPMVSHVVVDAHDTHEAVRFASAKARREAARNAVLYGSPRFGQVLVMAGEGHFELHDAA